MKQANKLKRSHFNLIEIALALGVLTIGLLGTLGLFSVGLNSNREAIGQNYSADAADEILHQLAASLKNNWGLVGDFSDTPPNLRGDVGDWTRDWSRLTDTIRERDYPLAATASPKYPVYRIRQTTNPAAPNEVIDFDAIVRVWRSPSEAWEYDPSTGSWKTPPVIDWSFDRRIMLNVEISWPSVLPFNARQKAYYSMEVAKDND